MIINGVRAENVLKYAVLRLDDVPERGLIAIIGDNESGKSSIGESICFALFGRTFSLDPDDLDKVIRWGETRCSIRLDFSTPAGQRYQIARFLDELGTHGASISRIGEQPIVRGVDEVTAVLRDIIGFGYAEFIESFYLAQREITTPHPHSSAVRAMAGVDTLERVSATCKEEIDRAQQQAHETAIQNQDIQAQISSIGLEAGHLASLEDERSALRTAQEADQAQIAIVEAEKEQDDATLTRIRNAAAAWREMSLRASLREHLAQAAHLKTALAEVPHRYRNNELTAEPLAAIETFAEDLHDRLDAFTNLLRQSERYRSRIAIQLGQARSNRSESAPNPGTEDAGSDPTLASIATFAERRASLQARQAKDRSSRRNAGLFSMLFLLVAIASGIAWGLLVQIPDSSGAQALAAWLNGLDATWQTWLSSWLPYGAGMVTLVAFLFLARAFRSNKRLKDLQLELTALSDNERISHDEYASLAGIDEIPLPEATARLVEVREAPLALRSAELRHGPQRVLLDAEAYAVYEGSFAQALHALERGLAATRAAAGREIERLHRTLSERVGLISRLDALIERERERVRRHTELEGIAETLKARIAESVHRVRVREIAIDLLEGAIHYISQRFNTDIRNLAADSLPRFTNGRYEHLQIDENLKVKAFSNEKRNFMDLDEISSGTQRQIMLAVRLALAQKLVNSVIQGPQALFLDEPFAFFDERRTASALALLPHVSPDFTQIWVTSQTFPADSHFDLCIECSAGQSHSPGVYRPGTPSKK